MGARGHDHNRGLTDLETPDPVEEHEPARLRPTPPGCRGHVPQPGLHALGEGLVIDFEHPFSALTVVAHRADEGDHRPTGRKHHPARRLLQRERLLGEGYPVVFLQGRLHDPDARSVEPALLGGIATREVAYAACRALSCMSPPYPLCVGRLENEGDDPHDDEPVRPPLPPDDRLWRHPSEMARAPLASPPSGAVPDRSRSRLALAGALLCSALAVSLGLFWLNQQDGSRHSTALDVGLSPTSTAVPSTVTAAVGKWVSNLSSRYADTIVGVDVYRGSSMSQGSGIVVGRETILSSSVLLGSSKSAVVVTRDGRRFEATLEGEDPDLGLALLHVNAPDMKPIHFSTHSLAVGELVVTLSPPRKYDGEPEVSVGALQEIGHPVMVGSRTLLDMAVVDAPLPSSGEGGLLLDQDGRVVGFDVLRDPVKKDMTVAAPASVVENDISQIENQGLVVHGWLGVGALSAQPAESPSAPGTPSTSDTRNQKVRPAGVQVGGVADPSPASQSGVEPGDVIVAVSGTPTSTVPMLEQIVRLSPPGTKLNLSIWRNGHVLSLPVTLGSVSS